jgi:hypothetical protein
VKCPECASGKVTNCVGVALDFDRDEFTVCESAAPADHDGAHNDQPKEGNHA